MELCTHKPPFQKVTAILRVIRRQHLSNKAFAAKAPENVYNLWFPFGIFFSGLKSNTAADNLLAIIVMYGKNLELDFPLAGKIK